MSRPLETLTDAGWDRAKEDFDPGGIARPLVFRRGWKCIVGKDCCTFWKNRGPGDIEVMFSVSVHDAATLLAAANLSHPEMLELERNRLIGLKQGKKP